MNVDLKIHPHHKMSTSHYCGLQSPALMLIVASYSVLRDGPVEKLWGGGEGNFRAAGIFFRYQIPCMNFFQALA